MAILVPTSVLSSVDLPTLVRPTSTANPDFMIVCVSTARVYHDLGGDLHFII